MSEEGQIAGVIHVQSSSEYEELKAIQERLIVVDYSATWCGPCRAIAPKYEALAENYDEAILLHVDIDSFGDHADTADISGVPTFKFFKNGAELERFSGANVQRLEDTIRKHLNYE